MSDKMDVKSLVFFLGGHDLEMLTIRELLEKAAPGRFHDKRLAWGARATEYKEEIGACLHRGETPVLVELKDDLGLPPGDRKSTRLNSSHSRASRMPSSA